MIAHLLYLLAAVLLVLLNGFFVLAEFSLVKVRASKLEELARKGNKTAELIQAMISRLDAYLSATQLGITLASLGLGWLGEPAFVWLIRQLIDLPGWWSSTVSHTLSAITAFVVITILHITVGELAPKMIAIRGSERVALFAARPLWWFRLILFVPLLVLNGLSNLILRILGVPKVSGTEVAHSEEELRIILGASHEKGQFTLSRLLMMENVLDFGTLRVEDVMIPIDKIVALRTDVSWSENFDAIRKSLHSRYPLKKSGGTRYESIVHVKDLALYMGDKMQAPDLDKIGRRVRSVKPDMPLEDLLTLFLKSGSAFAIVEKEGHQIGFVTMEDVIEELVGTIRDEFEPIKTVPLADIARPESIVLDLAGPKDEAIRRLAQTLGCGEQGAAAILVREAMASTGLGEGIAIPHARITGIDKPCMAIGRSPGLDFKSLDGLPTRLIFMLMTPHHDEGMHVHVLSRISALVSSEYLRQRILDAANPEEVMEVLRESDRSIPA